MSTKFVRLTLRPDEHTHGPAVAVLIDRIVAIEDGLFDQFKQVWLADLVMMGDVRIAVWETVATCLVLIDARAAHYSGECPLCDPRQ